MVIFLFTANTNGALLSSTSLTVQEVHLVLSLTYISHRYFASGRTVVISSPATYRDVKQELIAEIHRTAIWPVVVTADGNINIPEKSGFIDRDGSYIILIPDGNIKSLHREIHGLGVERNKYKRLWNSEARFVVAGANQFSISQQRDIFDYFSILRIHNCIIVSREKYVIDKEYRKPINVNDVDTGMKLGVYTWFPYQSSDRCTEVKDITVLDSWVISAQGHFTKDTDLFPRKINNNLNRCPMKAVVYDGHWDFTTQYVNHTYSNGSVSRIVVGMKIPLLRAVLQKMNMTFFHVPIPAGFEIRDGASINYLIGVMLAKEAYIALGDLGSNIYLESFLNTANTYYITNIRWYVPCSEKYPRWSRMFRILSLELWLVLTISIVTATISTTLIGRYCCTSELQVYKTLTSSLTNIWAVILGVSVSTMPRTPSLRSLFLAWVCFSVAFSTVFQAFLTTFLIDSGYKTPIQNMDELFDSGIKLAYPLGFGFLVEKDDDTGVSDIQKNYFKCKSLVICLNWVKYHKNASFLLADMKAEDYYDNGDFVGENSKPLVCRLEDGEFYIPGLTMVIFHGDPLMRRVNEIIDSVVAAGMYNYWISLRKHWVKLHSRKIAIVHPLDGYYSFNIYHMQPAFYILFMGWCLRTLCFLVEILHNCLLNKGK